MIALNSGMSTEFSRIKQTWQCWHFVVLKSENQLDTVIKHKILIQHYDKFHFILNLIQLSSISILFSLEALQKCQICQLCVLRKNSNILFALQVH